MASHLHCNPNDCEVLTEWLLKLVEKDGECVEIAGVEAVSVKKHAVRHE